MGAARGQPGTGYAAFPDTTLVIPPELLQDLRLECGRPTPQKEWGPIIAGYLYLGGLGAGAFLLAVVFDWLGYRLPTLESVRWGRGIDLAPVWTLWGPLVVALGAALLIVHLGRNRRLFFTACLNPRGSWLARGFLILAGFIVIGLACLALAVAAPRWVAEEGFAWRLLQALGVALAFLTAAYTGLLLRSMKYIPAWHTLVLTLLFVVSALSCGAVGLLLGVTAQGLVAAGDSSGASTVEALTVVENVLLPAELLVLGIYVSVLRRGGRAAVLSAWMLLSGTHRHAFWGIVVGLGLALPLALDVLSTATADGGATVVAAAVAVLTGGFVLRLLVLEVGVKEQAPLARASDWRARGIEFARGRT